MFEHIDMYLGDPILSLMERYLQDEREEKVNLSIGLYYDEDGQVPMLETVRQAKEIVHGKGEQKALYLPMSGSPAYCEQVQQLIFPMFSELEHGKNRIATIQTLGGSGALKVGADFLKRWFPESTVRVSDPTWENHITLFEGAGFPVYMYPYLNAQNGDVNIAGMLSNLDSLPPQTVVLLHPCCHNPTGADLTPLEWDAVIAILQRRQLIPFLDMAYYGLGQGLMEDLYVVKALFDSGIRFLLSTSFSKIFSLYGERVGALSVVCTNADEASRVLGQLKATVRRNYSSPPMHGALLVQTVLGDAQLRTQWLGELRSMRQRMRAMREKLYQRILKGGGTAERYAFLLNQQGMFSYTNFSARQVDELRREFGIYLIASGRMCIAGLNDGNVQLVADAMLAVEQVHNMELA